MTKVEVRGQGWTRTRGKQVRGQRSDKDKEKRQTRFEGEVEARCISDSQIVRLRSKEMGGPWSIYRTQVPVKLTKETRITEHLTGI